MTNNSELPVAITGCELSANSATVREGSTIEEWMHIGKQLCMAGASVRWWLGDWANFGVKHYGDRAAVAKELAEQIGVDEATLVDSMWVAESVTYRYVSLTWSHHREVAGLSAKEQAKWLELANIGKDGKRWSRLQLREAIRASQTTVAPIIRNSIGFNPMNWATEGMRWFRQQAEVEPIDRWSAERRQSLKKDLEPIVKIWEKL